jgi:hypothetical protein
VRQFLDFGSDPGLTGVIWSDGVDNDRCSPDLPASNRDSRDELAIDLA